MVELGLNLSLPEAKRDGPALEHGLEDLVKVAKHQPSMSTPNLLRWRKHPRHIHSEFTCTSKSVATILASGDAVSSADADRRCSRFGDVEAFWEGWVKAGIASSDS